MNKSNRQSTIQLYRHKSIATYLVYFGTALYGATCVSSQCVNSIIDFLQLHTTNNQQGNNLMKYKICPVCQLNFIEEHKIVCDQCNSTNNSQSKNTKNSVMWGIPLTFTKELGRNHAKSGYKVYNKQGELFAIAFMTDNISTPAHKHVELSINSQFRARYGQWHRCWTDGSRFTWTHLCSKLERDGSYTCTID